MDGNLATALAALAAPMSCHFSLPLELDMNVRTKKGPSAQFIAHSPIPPPHASARRELRSSLGIVQYDLILVYITSPLFMRGRVFCSRILTRGPAHFEHPRSRQGPWS